MRNKRPKYTGHRLSCPKCKSLRVDAGLTPTGVGDYQCAKCGYAWQGTKQVMAVEKVDADGKFHLSTDEQAFQAICKTQDRFVNEFMKSDFMKWILKD